MGIDGFLLLLEGLEAGSGYVYCLFSIGVVVMLV